MALLTIITPTYNRKKCLAHLYESLRNQSCKDFKWLIVDDGSTDQTSLTISQWVKKTDFEIIYIEKENGGKHTALNVGIKEIETPLTMIVDSDDLLLPFAVEIIKKDSEKWIDDNKIGSSSYLKCFPNGCHVVGLDRDAFVESYIRYRIKENRPGDMAEVFKTKVLKEVPFPEFPGEHFLSEDVVWIQIGLRYDCFFRNKAIYQCEYLEGGLTANDKPSKMASPLGSMMRGKQLMRPECGIRANVKGAIIYNAYKYNVHEQLPKILRPQKKRDRCLIVLTKPLGKYYHKRWSQTT